MAQKPLAPDEISLRAFLAKDRFAAVIFPREKLPLVARFWSTTGVSVSSRFAEANLGHLNSIQEILIATLDTRNPYFDGDAHQTLRERIVSYFHRAPLDPLRSKVKPDDVYLYQSGMASIYKPHTYMQEKYGGRSVLFGMAFMDTIVTMEEFGADNGFFGLGTDEDLRALDAYLRESRAKGRRVQAIWAEFPANPLLVTPDVARLRALATKHDVVLAIDDTIGSWANIDLLAVADLLVTSITKSFNGYADAIGGAAVLNPASPKYRELKALFAARYVPEFYVDDAVAIERNSRDYLTRSATLNANALRVVEALQARAEDSSSAVRQVHYPTTNPSGAHYRQFMRPATADFVPGFGCVFSIELDDLATTRAFYEALDVHKSVHLGAPFTLAFAYTMCAYKRKLDWAARFGLRPTQIRVSVGLEDGDGLVKIFLAAVAAADEVKRAGT